MLESAIQKILVLTIFFGTSIWKALDEMITMLAKQFGSSITNGSYWIIGIYLSIYIIGGFFIAWLAYRTIQSFRSTVPVLKLNMHEENVIPVQRLKKPEGKTMLKKLLILVLLMIMLSAVLFIFAADAKTGWLAVTKTITWTVSAILIWYMLIGPLITKAVQKLLRKNRNRYSDEVSRALAFLPVLKQLSVLAWQQSKLQHGLKRWQLFLTTFIHAALTYTEPSSITIK